MSLQQWLISFQTQLCSSYITPPKLLYCSPCKNISFIKSTNIINNISVNLLLYDASQIILQLRYFLGKGARETEFQF